MRCTIFFLFTLGALCADNGFAQDKASEKPKVLKQKVKMVEGLRFSPPRFAVKGQGKLELALENHDPNDQPHNFVLIQADALAEIQKASMDIGPESVARGFVPDHDGIIVASGLLNPEGRESLTIDVPKEAGIYYYVCTFPGHAQVMYGALYVNTKWKDGLAYDPHVPQIIRDAELQKTIAKVAVERPTFARLFLPDAGPAAIAVALPGAQNFCWDAGNCRLRYAWSGGFVDPTMLFNSNGSKLAKILGDVYWRSGGDENTCGMKFGDRPTAAVDFKGYRVIDGLPEFHYHVDGVVVKEHITATEGGKLAWRFNVEGAPGDVRVFAPAADGVSIAADAGARDGDFWRVPQAEADQFTLQISKQ
jgi:uncharacterized cupredoxin-like copper-binding protein